MNNFKSCVPCVCTGSGRKQVCEEHNNEFDPDKTFLAKMPPNYFFPIQIGG